MRTKLFLIISLVIFGVAFISTVFYTEILRREFVTSVDRQLRALALTLIGPEKMPRLTDLRKVDEMLTRELGRARTEKFVIIRNTKGEILFKDKTVIDLDLAQIPFDEQIHTEWRDSFYVRVFTLRLPEIPDRMLQIGVAMDRSLTPFYMALSARIKLSLSIMILGCLASWFLTSYLLRPLRQLGGFLAETSASVEKKTQLPFVPREIYGRIDRNDEFFSLVDDLNNLIKKVNDNYFMHRRWTTQMAHELKTPLSRLSLRLESVFLNAQNNPEREQIEGDLRRISSIINMFLDWAEVEYSENKRDVHACRVRKIIAAEVAALSSEDRQRVVQKIENEITALCHAQHMEQLIDNLLSNALKYATPATEITVQLTQEALTVINLGPGLSQEVLARLGQPFNKGHSAEKVGHGLGLAWIKSICRINGWSFAIEQKGEQTICSVYFNGTVVQDS